MNGKMVVLKPVVWNDNGYIRPAGIPTTGGYSKEHGYGHEEWNGRSDWVWKGWKVFHTQGKGEMHNYAADGRLAIIMTAMKDKCFYAVGVACNVFQNTTENNSDIARALRLPGYANKMWNDVAAIRSAHNNKRQIFDKHWRENMHVNWRCPQTHYAWFYDPILIEPNKLIPSEIGTAPRQAIVKMHSSYQAVRPDQALSIVQKAIPSDHPVIGWLSSGNFDPVKNKQVQNASPPSGGGNSASTPIDPFIKYMQMNEIVVSPLHHKLQSDFTAYLEKIGLKVKSNLAGVDLQYNDPERGGILVEIKPTEPATIRYAVRTAMGQLLDYYQRAPETPALLIVIDDKPDVAEADLALLNGFGLAWRKNEEFTFAWPSDS